MKRHALSTRLWHWLNAAAVIVLFMSGLNISNAHRYLYWGDYGYDPADAWMKVVRFPGWATLPQYYNLAAARDWHILAAWPFALGLLFMWATMLANGHFRRDLATRASDWTPGALLASLRRRGGTSPMSPRSYNPAQRILYGVMLGVVLPLLVFTGLAISPGLEPAAPWLVELLGGRQSARSLHFIAAWALAGFAVIHLALALVQWRLIGAMISGGRRQEGEADG